MSKIALISALVLAGMTASAQGAFAQPPAAGQVDAQANKPVEKKKGPLGGLLEPWDGNGDEITPKTVHLGGVFEPWHNKDEDKAKDEPVTPGPIAKKKAPLGGLLQPWGDRSDDKVTDVAKSDESVAKAKESPRTSPQRDDKATAVVTAEAAPVRKKGPLGGLLASWGDKHDDKDADTAKADEPVVKKKGLLGGLLQPWDDSSDKP